MTKEQLDEAREKSRKGVETAFANMMLIPTNENIARLLDVAVHYSIACGTTPSDRAMGEDYFQRLLAQFEVEPITGVAP